MGGAGLPALADLALEDPPDPDAEIAAELHMSVATVKAHVSKLLTKLEVGNRVQVALLVQEAG